MKSIGDVTGYEIKWNVCMECVVYMLYVICYMLYVICYMLYVICYMLYVVTQLRGVFAMAWRSTSTTSGALCLEGAVVRSNLGFSHLGKAQTANDLSKEHDHA